jgi:hypothetical protein
MCFEKATHIYDILVLGVTETEESSAIQAPKKSQAIQDTSFTKCIMNCLVILIMLTMRRTPKDIIQYKLNGKSS